MRILKKFANGMVASLLAVGLTCTAQAGEIDPHAGHVMTHQTMRSIGHYASPHIRLIRNDGKLVTLNDELDDGRPVIVNFIFTTCTTVCPVSSRIFSTLQHALRGEHSPVHLLSISIDPEQDTPSELQKYARKYRAGPNWNFYTGTLEASIATQQAFDVYHGDKMDQTPVTMLRAAPGEPWLRIDGFASAQDLLEDIHDLVENR